MKQPEKWKETIDPFSLNFKKFKLKEVLGYPHARNDVFYCEGEYNGQLIKCFVKYASKPDSNIKNEIKTLKLLDFDFLPQIIDCDECGQVLVTKEIEGERLSYILETTNKNSRDFMFEYGATLAKIHSVKQDFPKVQHRKFFDIPSLENLSENNIEFVYDYLIKNKPDIVNECFCHGDFHYANILWQNEKIVAVLDWELSGVGNREFDIAWAIINRSSQKFLKTQEEVDEFIEGYQSLQKCVKTLVDYYMILIYSHFISVDKKNLEYKKFVKQVLKEKLEFLGDNNE